MFTIEYNGVEKSLADWKLSDLTRSRQNLGVDIVQFFADGRAIDADEIFPYGSTIIIRRDRIASSGTNPTYSDGSRWFFGRIEPWSRSGNGRAEGQRGSCVGPMWYLVNRVFRQSVQSWKSWSTPGDPTTDPVFETKTFNHIFLNQSADGGKLTWREQVLEVLNWSITCGDPLQIGTVSPNFDVPVDEVKNITCAEALRKEYRWCLDATFWFDYTTEPYPTLHCKRQSELVPVSIDLTAAGEESLIEQIQLRERPDWKRPYVLLQFEQEINGVLNVIEDKWPDPIPAGPPPGGLETTVDLKGWSANVLVQHIDCATYNVSNLDWWKSKVAWLNDTKSVKTITLLTAGADAPTLKDREDGGAPEASFVRELLPGGGSIADWMDFGSEKVRASAFITVEFQNGTKKENVKIHHDFTITDATTGTYRTTQVTQVGDPVPVGLAKEMWTSLQALACQGSVTLTDEEVPDTLDFGNALNFSSPLRPTWSQLNALIQQIDESASDGRCTISFGAPEHLGASELVDLLRVARARFNPSPLSLRSGNTGGIGSTALPDQGGDGNSTSGAGEYQTHVVSQNSADGGWQIKNDASGARSTIAIQKVDADGNVISVKRDDAFGAPTTEAKPPSIELDAGDIANGRQIRFRACNLSVGGQTKTVYVACSEAFTGGGAGATLQLVKISQVTDNTITCSPITMTPDPDDVEKVVIDIGASFIAAKALPFRRRASEIVNGVLINYIYGNGTGTFGPQNYRTAKDAAREQAEAVFPLYTTSLIGPGSIKLADLEAALNGCIHVAPMAPEYFPAVDGPVTWIEVSPARVWAAYS